MKCVSIERGNTSLSFNDEKINCDFDMMYVVSCNRCENMMVSMSLVSLYMLTLFDGMFQVSIQSDKKYCFI